MAAQHQVKNVAIIGAGPCGLAAAKYLLAEKYFNHIDIFEQRNQVGGIWNYSTAAEKNREHIDVPQLDAHKPVEQPIWRNLGDGGQEASFISPLYDGLETNIPKNLMCFSDLPFPEDSQLLPPFSDVLDYVVEYAKTVWDLIQFQVQVVDVRIADDNLKTWSLTTKNLKDGSVNINVYDAVVVASGHYNLPYIPSVTGISAWNGAYKGLISHAKSYTSPAEFRNKKVIVVGNSASGADIGAQIGAVCRRPLLISSKSEGLFSLTDAVEKTTYPEIVEFLPPNSYNRAVRFKNGVIEHDIDAIVYCTGYLYSFPFLSSLDVPVIDDGTRALHVYEQLFYIEHPTLVFPVLPQRIIPFVLSENQSAVFARVWSRRLSLPSKKEMYDWEKEFEAVNGPGKAFHLLPFPKDANYLNKLYDWASSASPRPGLPNYGKGKLGVHWGEKERWLRERLPSIKSAFLAREDRHHIRRIEELGFDFDAWRSTQRENKL